MNCEELRKTLPQLTGEIPSTFFHHLDQCAACNEWLETGIKHPPLGLSEPILEQPSADLAKRILPQGPSWLDRMIQRILAALAIGAVAVCLWVALPRTAINPSKPVQQVNHVDFSFLPEIPSFQEINFLEPFTKVVTDEQVEPSQSWSFLENENSLNFLEDEQEEES